MIRRGLFLIFALVGGGFLGVLAVPFIPIGLPNACPLGTIRSCIDLRPGILFFFVGAFFGGTAEVLYPTTASALIWSVLGVFIVLLFGYVLTFVL